jgi:DNA-binding IscR family transcriptional regulator
MFTEKVYTGAVKKIRAGASIPWKRTARVAVSVFGCVSFFSMAQSGRFQLGVRVLAVLASEPDAMHTSSAIAETLKESAVMVRRTFLLLHEAGLIVQRKGPHGGAKLKLPAKQIGLGDVFEATAGDWLSVDDKAVSAWMKKVRADAVAAMNEHSLAGVVKRMKKGK